MKSFAILCLLGATNADFIDTAARACMYTLGMNDEDFEHLN